MDDMISCLVLGVLCNVWNTGTLTNTLYFIVFNFLLDPISYMWGVSVSASVRVFVFQVFFPTIKLKTWWRYRIYPYLDSMKNSYQNEIFHNKHASEK